MPSRVDIDPNLEAQLRSLGAQAGQRLWYRPVGLSGRIDDPVAGANAFSRAVTSANLISAITDLDNPGTTGDLLLATLTADYLSIMQRAMAARYGGQRPQATLHAQAVAEGLASPTGVLIGSVLGYFQRLSQESKT